MFDLKDYGYSIHICEERAPFFTSTSANPQRKDEGLYQEILFTTDHMTQLYDVSIQDNCTDGGITNRSFLVRHTIQILNCESKNKSITQWINVLE